jgi:tripartite-type tricarboxylate transporter receptor subunit TctC
LENRLWSKIVVALAAILERVGTGRLHSAARSCRHQIDQPTFYTTAGYDARRDFQAVGLIASMPVAPLANPTFPPKSVFELIALAKKNPGQIAVGTSVIRAGSYLCAELFKVETSVDVNIIPYKGTAPVMTDLVGGHVPVAFGVLPPALGNIAAGQLRVLAVTSPRPLQPVARRSDGERVRATRF